MTLEQYNEIYNLALNGSHKPENLAQPRKAYVPLIKRFYKYNNNDFLTGNIEKDIFSAKRFLFEQSNKTGKFKANTYRNYASAIIWIFDQMYGVNFNHKSFKLPPADRSIVMPLLVEEQQKLDTLLWQFINSSKSNWIQERRTYLSNCYQVLKFTGMRIGEFTAIDWKEVQLEKYITSLNINLFPIKNEKVRQDRRNKKSAYRWAGISPELWDFFKNSDIKFANIISYTTTLRAFFNQFFKFARENGFNGRLRPHILRHTAVYNLFKQGVSLEYIALIIGDEPRTVWEHYIKNNPDIIADALSKIKTPSVIQTNFSSPIFDKLN